MFQQWIKAHVPSKENIKNSSSFKTIHHWFHNSEAWKMNPKTVARGVGVGLFVAFIPVPFQMLLAAFLGILLRANVIIAVSFTWITNPFTFIPINYFIFWVGKRVLFELGDPENIPAFSWEFKDAYQFWSSLLDNMPTLAKAYLVGLPIVSLGVAVLGYLVVRVVWFLSVKKRKRKFCVEVLPSRGRISTLKTRGA